MTTRAPQIGLWMYRDDGGDIAQVKLKQALEDLGVVVVNDFDMRTCYCKDGMVYTQDDFNLSKLDLFYHMNFDERTNHQKDLLHALEISGVPVVNSFKTHQLAGDKFSANQILRQHDILVPNSLLLNRHITTKKLIELTKNWRSIVLKARNNSGGRGIIKINNTEQLCDYIESIRHFADNFYLEEFIDFGDHDYRIELVDGMVTSCYSRKKQHDFKTNSYAGADIIYCDKSAYDEPIKLAQQAARIIGVDVTAVDIIRCLASGRYYVLEVNDIMGIFIEAKAAYKNTTALAEKPITLPPECLTQDNNKITMLAAFLLKLLNNSSKKRHGDPEK